MNQSKPALILFLRSAVSILILTAILSSSPAGVSAQTSPGTIAYVVDDTRDEIRLVEPDGSNDRRLWISDVADPYNAYDIWSLIWRPDGTQLAFASNHEGWCSINNADIFTVQADGTGYRRITEAPSCAALATFPQGKVQVPVVNSGYSAFSGFVYFQGADSAQVVNLAPGGSTTLTFEQVADFGAGALQIAGFMIGSQREINVGTAVDVQAGGTVSAGTLAVWETSSYSIWETHSPAWRYGSNLIAYVLNLNSVRQISSNPAPLEFGSDLLTASQSSMPDFVNHLAYGPNAATADQLLYNGGNAFQTEDIYRVTEGSDTPGEVLVSYESFESILGLAWLPDGSGFVYSVKEYSYFPDYVESANLFVYTFAAGKSERLTSFSGEFTGRMAVSPDSQVVVFERGSELNMSLEVDSADLWMINIDGSGLKLFVNNGRAPAWSLMDGSTTPPPPPPNTLDNRIYLPILQR